MKCANYCGNDLVREPGEWDFHCPVCQSPEAIQARYAAQFDSRGQFIPRKFTSTKITEY